MKISRSLTSFACLAMLVFVTASQAAILNFQCTLDGAQAANCAGTGSAATGTGTFTLDTNTGEVNYNITFDIGLLGNGETVAHTHGPAPACSGASPVYTLPNGNPKVGMVTLTAPQMQDMIDGNHYVNIHSNDFPGGEIRGQILQSSAVIPTLSEWAMLVGFVLLSGMVVLFTIRRRTVA